MSWGEFKLCTSFPCILTPVVYLVEISKIGDCLNYSPCALGFPRLALGGGGGGRVGWGWRVGKEKNLHKGRK